MNKQALIEEIEKQYYIIGKPVERIDAKPKVTGEAIYGYDLVFPKMLYGKIKHSSIPHGIIKRIDTSKAESLPGVRAVITGKDIPDHRYGLVLFDRYLIAKDRVRFIGEAVAAVAADTPEIAEKAVNLIEVEYEELPAVFDPEEAIKQDAPILHPDLRKYGTSKVSAPWIPFDMPNLNNYRRVVFGNVEESFKKSDVIVENIYETSMVQHAHLEPQSCVCIYNYDDTFTVYTSTQTPFRLRFELSLALNVPENRIRVVSPYVGGGFGNKLTIYAEPIACILSKKTRRPVKIVLTREEVFTFTTVRPPTRIYVKDGASRDGKILARQVRFYINGGAYSGGSGIAVYTYLAAQALATYKPESVKFEAFSIYTNLPPQGPLRGVGPAILDFAFERQMDILAKKLGLDPIEIRLRNISKQGEENIYGEIVDEDYSKVLLTAYDALMKKIKESNEEPTHPWKRGIGYALSSKYSLAPTASSATVKLREDGVIEVFIGSTEIGMGNYTAMQQIVAEEFQIPMERVSIAAAADTEFSPFDEAQMSSRTTVSLGNALVLACRKLKRKIAEYAANKLNEDPDHLEVKEGFVVSKRNPDKKIRLEDLFARGKIRTGTFLEGEGELIASANWFIQAGIDKETGRIYDKYGNKVFERVVNFYTPTGVASEVWVNVETGHIKVKRLVTVVDAGKVINPKLVEGQIIGGSAMGISIALFEGLQWQNGYALNPNFADYKLIQHADLPEIIAIATETPLPHGPFGARGVGEAGLLVSDAIPNAVSNAIGKEVKKIPLTPEYILKLLAE
jgi:CO/xanthine dehydrogenase Mo-binding subunit